MATGLTRRHGSRGGPKLQSLAPGPALRPGRPGYACRQPRTQPESWRRQPHSSGHRQQIPARTRPARRAARPRTGTAPALQLARPPPLGAGPRLGLVLRHPPISRRRAPANRAGGRQPHQLCPHGRTCQVCRPYRRTRTAVDMDMAQRPEKPLRPARPAHPHRLCRGAGPGHPAPKHPRPRVWHYFAAIVPLGPYARPLLPDHRRAGLPKPRRYPAWGIPLYLPTCNHAIRRNDRPLAPEPGDTARRHAAPLPVRALNANRQPLSFNRHRNRIGQWRAPKTQQYLGVRHKWPRHAVDPGRPARTSRPAHATLPENPQPAI